MAALIKASSRMLAGEPQLTTYNVSTSADGSLAVNAEFVVLSQHASLAYQSFRVGSGLHSQLWAKADVKAALLNYRANQMPVLVSAEISTVSGLSTISVSYAAESMADPGTDSAGNPIITQEITTTTDLRSFSGSYASGDTSQSVSFSFDYYATTVTAENGMPDGVQPGEPLNLRGVGSVVGLVSTQSVFSRRTYRNNLAQYKETNSVTIIYVLRSGLRS